MKDKRWSLLVIVLSLFIALLVSACSAEVKADENKTNDSNTVSEKPAYFEEFRGGVVDPSRNIEDFSIPSTTGEDFTFSDYEGKILLLYFGYLTCPDVCPATSADMMRILNELDDTTSQQVQVVFVTVDPERDTLERLDAWLTLFHTDFIGLRGEGETMQHIFDQFGVQTAKQQVGDSPLSYLMDHTATIFLVGPDGRLWEQFLFGTSYVDILHDLRIILENTPT